MKKDLVRPKVARPGGRRSPEADEVLAECQRRGAAPSEIDEAAIISGLVLVKMNDGSEFVLPPKGWKHRIPVRDWYRLKPEARTDAFKPSRRNS